MDARQELQSVKTISKTTSNEGEADCKKALRPARKRTFLNSAAESSMAARLVHQSPSHFPILTLAAAIMKSCVLCRGQAMQILLLRRNSEDSPIIVAAVISAEDSLLH